MREIKFRGWYRDRKVMFEGTTLEEMLRDPIDNLTNIDIMQFTGMKDKNGKEIYEGDIVKNTTGKLEKIVFNRGSFNAQSINYPNANLYLLEFYNGYIEVIGNIYENSNLLEVL